ncbi:cupin [Ruania zhangjianzhongii]|uniref:cupin n=1 Tax=Ruania zhangjianzhongii TaxID=2603206 RepID=UPI0011D2793F|nr:cupin [Ruania zhangjianzhongii]
MSEPTVRRFDAAANDRTIRFGDREVFLTPAVTADEGGALSAYSAQFGKGERAELPAPYGEVWVVLHGCLRLRSRDSELTVHAGQYAHVPEHTPGELEALQDTTLACISVPAH